MTSLDKCNGICNNAFDDFSAIVCIPSKAKGVDDDKNKWIKDISKTSLMQLDINELVKV